MSRALVLRCIPSWGALVRRTSWTAPRECGHRTDGHPLLYHACGSFTLSTADQPETKSKYSSAASLSARSHRAVAAAEPCRRRVRSGGAPAVLPRHGVEDLVAGWLGWAGDRVDTHVHRTVILSIGTRPRRSFLSLRSSVNLNTNPLRLLETLQGLRETPTTRESASWRVLANRSASDCVSSSLQLSLCYSP